MNYLFLNPINPSYSKVPLPGIPILMSLLESQGITSKFIDLNLIIKSDFLYSKEGVSEILAYFDNIQSEIIDNYQLKKKFLISDIEKVNFFKYILKDNKLFYNRILYKYATRYFFALNTLLFSWEYKLYNKIEDKTNELKINLDILNEYYKYGLYNLLYKKVENLIYENITNDTLCIGITILSKEEFPSALYLCSILKKKYDVHINIGGKYCDYLINSTNLKDLFCKYFDSISIGENYYTVTELIEYLNGKRKIDDVSNIVFFNKDKIIINKSSKKYRLDKLPLPYYNGYSKDQYMLPEIIIPIQTSLSCYWGKCIYCECTNQGFYRTKSVKQTIEEIEKTTKYFNSKYINFWDNAIHPIRMEELANSIIGKKLNIKYSIYARLEEQFTYELFLKMKKSGCSTIYWGFDSASEKILKYINKGTDIKKASLILKNSKKAGIKNIVYVIVGYPTEEKQDIQKDINFIKANKYNILYVNSTELMYIPETSLTKDKENQKAKVFLSKDDQYKYVKELRKHNKYYNFTNYDLPEVMFLRCTKGMYDKPLLIEKILSYFLNSEIVNNLVLNIYYIIYNIVIKFKRKS